MTKIFEILTGIVLFSIVGAIVAMVVQSTLFIGYNTLILSLGIGGVVGAVIGHYFPAIPRVITNFIFDQFY